MVCRDFILPEPASYVFFYAVFNLRNLLYIIFTLFATMSCMDKYDGKHEYILKMTCRYPNHYDDTSVTEIK